MTANDAPLIARLATHLQRPVPEIVRTRARLHLLDWLACVAGTRRSAVAQIAIAISDDPLERAAFLGNLLEMDDVHRGALLHPGPVVWPAALNDAKSLDATLEAGVRGYEAMITVGATMDARHYEHWHPTATMGVFGSAAAAASLRNLSQARTGWALGNAASLAGGGFWHMRHDDVMTKQWHVVQAASTGMRAARFAEGGLTGPLAILEGPQGIYAAMTREPKPMVFTDHWRIEEVSFKPWAACRHAHPAIDCALELRAAGKLEPPFHVATYADAISFCDKPSPATENEAKFSLQHGVAVVASGSNATPADFTPSRIAELADLRAQVFVCEDVSFTARYPEHFGARVNGLQLDDCRGDPERPVTQTDIVAKIHLLAEWGGLPPFEAERAADLALRGDDAGAIVTMLETWLS